VETQIPVDWNHIGPRGRGCVTLESHQGSARPLQGSVHAGSYTDYPGGSYLARCLLQVSVSLHQSEGLVLGSAASFSCLEGDPGITPWVRTSQFQEPLQGTGPGSRDPLPNGAWQLSLAGTSKILEEQYWKYD
jgi:hypothetical protein